ncbi:MAG: hypothetical protein AMJ88_10660 [Anaerolineae bacterium SM23_ 63]|nr:MAG: hypothetical protein AMJ88_10660 [Anaerolineae bacterium SM23_ 63]
MHVRPATSTDLLPQNRPRLQVAEVGLLAGVNHIRPNRFCEDRWFAEPIFLYSLTYYDVLKIRPRNNHGVPERSSRFDQTTAIM